MNERRQPNVNETWERYGRYGVITDVNLSTGIDFGFNDETAVVTTGLVTVTWNDTGSQDEFTWDEFLCFTCIADAPEPTEEPEGGQR